MSEAFSVTLNHLMSDDPRLRPAVAVTRRATSPGSTSFCQRSQLGIAIIVVRNSRQRIRPPKDGSPGGGWCRRRSHDLSSAGCRSCEPGLPNCRRSRLVASIHLLFVYFAGRGADAMLNSCCRGRYTPCSSVRTRETRISSPSPANTMVGSPLHVSPKATVRS